MDTGLRGVRPGGLLGYSSRPELLASLLCLGRTGRTCLTRYFYTDPFVIRRILAHFGLPTEVIPLEPPRPPPEPDLPWEAYGDTA
jgi:hypothetical protein